MITVAGLSPSLDLTFVVEKLHLGEIHRPSQVVRCAGGKPLNMARVAAALGGSVRVVAALGGPAGAAVEAGLRSTDLELDVIESAVETRTCVSIASVADHTLTEVYAYAPPLPEEAWTRLRAALSASLAERPGWLSISGSPPPNLAPGCIAELVEVAAGHGVRTAVDTSGPALTEAVRARPDLVKVNRFEAAALLGVDADQELSELARAIQRQVDGLVVLTDGRAGAVAVDGHAALRASSPWLDGHFPVGSGDAFLAGLVTELDGGRPLPVALRTAVAAGAANALVPGPGVLSAETVGTIAERVDLAPG